MSWGSTCSSPSTPPRSGRSSIASSSGAASRAWTRSCTRRRCTSRTSDPTAGRRSWTRTSRARSTCSRRPSPRVSVVSSTRARRAPSAGRSPRRRGARSVDHRGRRADPEERLRRHEDGSGGSLRARPSRPRVALPDPAHVTLLPGGRRSRRGAERLRRRQPQGQRAPLSQSRHRGRRERAPARTRACSCAWLRPLHRQRDHAVHAG